ncbi:MAG TPA: DegV family protein, partial [Cellulomonas sp.]
PVRVVDSRSAGLGLGLAVIAAAEAVRGGTTPAAAAPATGAASATGAGTATGAATGADRGDRSARGRGLLPGRRRRAQTAGRPAAPPWAAAASSPGSSPETAAQRWEPDGGVVARTAERVGRSTSAWFLVDSLDHLRRGGRLSGPAAALGTVLGLRPVLTLREGRIEVAERVRTRRAARDRLVELAATEIARRVAAGAADHARGGPGAPSAGSAGVRVGVQHLGRAEVAEELADRIRTATGLGEDDVLVREVGAVLGGHLGVGALALVITDR